MVREDGDVARGSRFRELSSSLENRAPKHSQGLLHMGGVEVGHAPLPGPGPNPDPDLEVTLDLGGVQDAARLLWRKQSFLWRLM